MGTLRIALVAGEASSDLLGAGLARELKVRFPDAVLEGMAGPEMVAAGVEPLWRSDELAVIGLFEVLRHLPRLLRLRAAIVARYRAAPPDVLIGIDSPDFTLGIERRLKAHGVPTVHYVSPSVWAWRAGRVAGIAAAADRVLCLLPLEPAHYAGSATRAEFVGHPAADALRPVDDRNSNFKANIVDMAALGYKSPFSPTVVWMTHAYVDSPAGAAAPLYLRRNGSLHLQSGQCRNLHDPHRYFPIHRHPGSECHLDLQRNVARGDGAAHRHRERTGLHHHGQRHRAHRVAVAERGGGTSALLSAWGEGRTGDCADEFEARTVSPGFCRRASSLRGF